jgi:hypothetical protein
MKTFLIHDDNDDGCCNEGTHAFLLLRMLLTAGQVAEEK